MWNTTEQAGEHTIYVQIDPKQWSLDSDRLNNLASTIVTVVPEYICGDINGNGQGPNVADLTYLVSYLFKGGPPPPIMQAANVNGEGGININIADLTYLVSYLFKGGPEPIC